MKLVTDAQKAAYSSVFDDLHETFGRDIVVTKVIKEPKPVLEDSADDYDFTHDHNTGNEEFEEKLVEATFKARIKYIDRQDKDYQLIAGALQGQVNLGQENGLIRIKVDKEACEFIKDASYVTVDGNHTNVVFRDRPHGLFDIQYFTFYLQRTT